MDFDIIANRRDLISIFPGLAGDDKFRITSPKTVSYNCIAWAMGFDARWVANTAFPGLDAQFRFVWWPDGVEVSQRPEALIAAFASLGFELTDNRGYEPGFDKAVLYSDGNKWTHASRLLADDMEHSKFGALWDACHGCDKFSGSDYGTPYAYMRRPHNLKRHFLEIHPARIGSVKVNEDRLGTVINQLRALRGLPPL